MVNKCKKCNTEFRVAHWNRGKQFCTRECYWSSGILKKPNDQRKKVECGVCKKFYVLWQDNKNAKKFCSRKCFSVNQSEKMKGVKLSEATKKAIRFAHLGKVSPCIGQKRLNMQGENHPQYKKDRNELVQSEKKHLDGRYREWMVSVKKRDNWKCKINNRDCSGRLEAHHILDWKNYPELRYEVNNGITLCHAHHPRGRRKEAELSPYFKKLVAEMQ